MNKLLLLLLLLLLLVASVQHSYAQTNDITLDSIFNRFNVGEHYQNGIEYFRLPQNQMRPLNCSALISNIGTNDITNCHLKVEVKYGGASVFTEYSDSINSIAGNQDSLYLNNQIDFTGQPQGFYTIVYSLLSDSSEINLSNNTDSLLFEITQNELSRSDFIITDSTNNYYQDTLSGFGYVFKMENDACLSAVYPYMSHDPVNGSLGIGGVTATLFVLDTITGEFDLKAPSAYEVVVDTSDRGKRIEIPFDIWNDLYAKNTYLVTVNSQFHDFYLSQYSIDSTIYYSFTDGTPGSFMNDKNAPLKDSRMVKMDIAFNGGPYCNAGIQETDKFNIEIFPNPSQGILQVKLSDEITEDVGIEIYNMNGQLIFKKKIFNQSVFQLEIDHLTDGVYVVV